MTSDLSSQARSVVARWFGPEGKFDVSRAAELLSESAEEIEWLVYAVSRWQDIAKKAVRERNERQAVIEDQADEIERLRAQLSAARSDGGRCCRDRARRREEVQP